MRRFVALILLNALLLMPALAANSSTDAIYPTPTSVELLKGSIKVAGINIKCDSKIDSVTLKALNRFATDLSFASGRTSPVSKPFGLQASVENATAKGMIFLVDESMALEEYSISIDKKVMIIKASSSQGFILALETLRQMLPARIYPKVTESKGKWVLPCCEIKDAPLHSYRGIMLDCSSHFWSTDDIKYCLDLMERAKLNHFVWRLSGSTGWRMEVNAYPLLTQIGSWREGSREGPSYLNRYGGYYSQKEIREIVNYAQERGITVIPEIDMPAHTLSVLAAYPDLGCKGGSYAVAKDWTVSEHMICAGKSCSYELIDAIMGDLAKLFPSEYVHIGGFDWLTSQWLQCPDCQAIIEDLDLAGETEKSKALLDYFFDKVKERASAHGKKLMCRDEILKWIEPKVLKEAEVMLGVENNSNLSEFEKEGLHYIYISKEASAEELIELISPSSDAYKGYSGEIWTQDISTSEELESRIVNFLIQNNYKLEEK